MASERPLALYILELLLLLAGTQAAFVPNREMRERSRGCRSVCLVLLCRPTHPPLHRRRIRLTLRKTGRSGHPKSRIALVEASEDRGRCRQTALRTRSESFSAQAARGHQPTAARNDKFKLTSFASMTECLRSSAHRRSHRAMACAIRNVSHGLSGVAGMVGSRTPRGWGA